MVLRENPDADVPGSSPEEFANVIKADVEKWGKIIRVANIKLQ